MAATLPKLLIDGARSLPVGRLRGRVLVARFVRLLHGCPNCQSPELRFLETTSQSAWVDYFRCDDCGHVWTISRDDQRRVTHVTPLTHSDDSGETH